MVDKELITDDLFNKVLLGPAIQGADTLYIVSGFASATMAYRHFELLKTNKVKDVTIKLILGMSAVEGVPRKSHLAFKALSEKHRLGSFDCNYLTKTPAIHSKLYAWSMDGNPQIGFVGSANYTQTGFGENQREALSRHDASEIIEFYNRVVNQSISCVDDNVSDVLEITEEVQYRIPDEDTVKNDTIEAESRLTLPSDRILHVRISLLDSSGNLPTRSGLNWGQRPEYSREPNQAYIRVPSSVYKSRFFPSRKTHFTILTDNDKVLVCATAQDSSKAIHTPHNNSLLGEYFRFRLGVPYGNPVALEDLNRYGRTDIDFYQLDDETYYMDFSVDTDG